MFRQIINKVHLIIGLVSGSIMIIVALTGCIYAFEEEIRSFSPKQEVKIEVGEKKVSIRQILDSVKTHQPKLKITGLMISGKPDKPITIFTKEKKNLSVNPYTAKILENEARKQDWLATDLKLHRELLLGKIGKQIIYWNAWLFAFMLVSGFILWLPKRIKNLKQSLKIKTGASTKKLTFDLHSVGGFYALPFLLITVATGIHIGSHGDTKGKKLQSAFQLVDNRGIIDKSLSQTSVSEPFKSIRIMLPKDSIDVLKVSINYPSSGLKKESSYVFDQYSGKLLTQNLYSQDSLWERIWKTDVDIHTGKIGGIFGKIIAFLASSIALILPITGFMIWRNKRKLEQNKKNLIHHSFSIK